MEFIPNGYLKHNLLFANTAWIRELIEKQSVPNEFLTHPNAEADDIIAILKDGKIPKVDQNMWEILSVDRYPRRHDTYVLPLPNPVFVRDEKPCFDEVIQYVAQSNFTNSWREGFKKFSNTLIGDSSKRPKDNNYVRAYHDSILLEILCQLYNCPIIDLTEEIEPLPIDEEASTIKHCVSAIACIITDKEFVVLRHFDRYSVHHMLRFSPCMIEGSNLLPLFIVYQLLIAINDFHKKGLSIGNISLDDIVINNEYYIALKPNPMCNLIDIDLEKNIPNDIKSQSPSFQQLLSYLKSKLSDAGEDNFENMDALCDNFLGNAVHLWVTNQLSNFDYILLLNYLSGRTFSDPNHYPVMPWIRDFTSQNGGWRDLSKSKYR